VAWGMETDEISVVLQNLERAEYPYALSQSWNVTASHIRNYVSARI